MSAKPTTAARLEAALGPDRLVALGALVSVVALAATEGTVIHPSNGLTWFASGVAAALFIAAAVRSRTKWRVAPILGGLVGAVLAGAAIATHRNDTGWFVDHSTIPVFLGGGALILWLAPWIAGNLVRRREGDLSPWQRLMADGTGEGSQPPIDRAAQRRVAKVTCAALAIVIWPLGWISASRDVIAPSDLRSGFELLIAALLIAALPIVARRLADRRRLLDLHRRAMDRQTVGAHLHDSVLQTLALIQRTDDPTQIKSLARQQERDLRRWLSGREERAGEQLAPALRAVAADVEDEYAELGAEIEVVTVSDVELDDRVAAVVWATREALRNAVRHGGGIAHLSAEVKDDAVVVWIRDEGPGFSITDVPTTRRGVRDAILGRMQHAGGFATITGDDGGTEVQIVLPLRQGDGQ